MNRKSSIRRILHVVVLLIGGGSCFAESYSPSIATPVSPPSDVVERLKLDAFYGKYVSADGIPVIGSKRVEDAALMEAAYLINSMLVGRRDIRDAIIKNRTRFVVMAAGEFTTDVPEHATLTPKNFWDRRARGLGATPHRPATSCGEENLLRFPGDPYHKENILVHEFAHTIHHMGLNTVDKTFEQRLKETYDKAMSAGLWKAKYASTNRAEYWAEGVQSYFGTNRPPDHDHNYVDTRDELKTYDARLFKLIDEVFRGNPWQYSNPETRTQQPHLKGSDRTKFPTFKWPARLAGESAKIEVFKKKRLKEAEDAKQGSDRN
ncbi:MAG: hypothetical protein O3A00_21495 [Planctomycetota bacterium]|nr:hypothetical protein [Planctomycetota bacterium]